MTADEFKAQYPHLTQTMDWLSKDTETQWARAIVLPAFLTPSLEVIESQAAQLSDSEKEVFAIGDEEERENLVNSTGFVVLDDFLTESFEGILSNLFWST